MRIIKLGGKRAISAGAEDLPLPESVDAGVAEVGDMGVDVDQPAYGRRVGRSTTMQGAQGSAVLIVLPVIALVGSQATGLLLFDTSIALIASAVLLLIDAAVFKMVVGRFQRERIITRL